MKKIILAALAAISFSTVANADVSYQYDADLNAYKFDAASCNDIYSNGDLVTQFKRDFVKRDGENNRVTVIIVDGQYAVASREHGAWGPVIITTHNFTAYENYDYTTPLWFGCRERTEAQMQAARGAFQILGVGLQGEKSAALLEAEAHNEAYHAEREDGCNEGKGLVYRLALFKQGSTDKLQYQCKIKDLVALPAS